MPINFFISVRVTFNWRLSFVKYLRLVSSAKSVKISWPKYLASKANGPLSSLAVTAFAWDGSCSHVESGLWKSFFCHKIPLFFGSTFFFADVDGGGELAPLRIVMLVMGESLSSSEEDGSYSTCCPSSNSSSSEPEISMPDPSRTAAITSWALKTRFTFCGAHTFLDSSLNALPGARDGIFPATSGADVQVVNDRHATRVETSLSSDSESEWTAWSTCWALNRNLTGTFPADKLKMRY